MGWYVVVCVVSIVIIMLAGIGVLAIARGFGAQKPADQLKDGTASDVQAEEDGDPNAMVLKSALQKLDEYDERRRRSISIAMLEVFDLQEIEGQHGQDRLEELVNSIYDLITDAFGNECMCYRAGRGEFLVISVNGERIYGAISDIKARAAEMAEASGIRFDLAAGSSSYDMCIDRSVKNTVSRTSQRMYVNKIQMIERAQTADL